MASEDDRAVFKKQLAFSVGAGAILFGLLFGLTTTPAVLGAVLSLIGSTLAHLLQLGTGTRHLLTGMKLDLALLKKTEVEVEKLKQDMVKTGIDIVKATEELRRLTTRVQLATPDEVVGYATGELQQLLRQASGQERSF